MKPLKLIKNELRQDSISGIIGRDAKEVLKRKPPSFEPDAIDFWNKNIKWLTSLIRIDRNK